MDGVLEYLVLKEKSCRLCFNKITDEDYKVTDDFIREMIGIILLKLNLDKVNYFVCSDCIPKLYSAFDFKSTCLYTENEIVMFVNSEDEQADLQEVYIREQNTMVLAQIEKGQKICRLCVQLITGEFTSFSEFDIDMIDAYIPEVNFSYTKDPVICKLCYNSLLTHTSFINSCHSTNENRKNMSWNIKSEKNQQNSSQPLQKGIEQDVRSENIIKNTYITEDVIYKHCLAKKQYECGPCNYKTKRRNLFKRHMLKHNPSRVNKCRLCGYAAKNRFDLRAHLAGHRTPGANIYKCDSCDYRCKRSTRFHRHLVSHEKRSLSCDMCDFKTIFKKTLQSHKLTHVPADEHAKPEQKKSVKCLFCNYSTNHKNHLAKHMSLHKQFVKAEGDKKNVRMRYFCSLCSYSTKESRYLRKHMATHRNPEIRKCNLCGYTAAHRYDFNQHKAAHIDPEDPKLFKCTVCDRRTYHFSNLDRHALMHQKCLK